MKFQDKAKNLVGKAGFKVKKYSPELLIFAGVTGVVASTVMACKTTLKLEDEMAELNAKQDMVKQFVEDNGYSERYTEEDARKDKAIVTTQKAVKFVSLYAPAILVGTAGVAAILYSHKIMSGRNAVLASTLTAVTTNFKDYRKRVADRYGEDVEQEIHYNVDKLLRQEKTEDEEGNEVDAEIEEHNMTGSPDQYSVYARCFDESCSGWESNAEYNLMYLRRTQDYFNDLLKSRGHVFLNEVYEVLGFPHTKIGQRVGWVYDENNTIGDNYIDFGVYDLYNENCRLFVNGHEKSIWLDFNVDGDIWHCL